MAEATYILRTMKEDDFNEVHALWMSIHGFGIRSIDDSEENVKRFIRRNPDTSIVACMDGKIVGAILCGQDGRRGCFYHVCVHEDYRKHGIGKAMAMMAMEALKKELRPEFINRIDEIIVFHKLTDTEISQIIDIMLKEVTKRLEAQKIKIELEPEVKELIASKGIDKNFGDRG
jgi:GNAT superfamily N-acetyltransferase